MSNLTMEPFEAPLQSDMMDTLRRNSLKRFQALMEKRIKSSRDGVDTTDHNSFVPRSNLVQRILQAAFSVRAILIRAPPASGKTSLTQLLYIHLFEDHPDVLPVLLNCIDFDKNQSFEDQFSARSGLSKGLLDVCNATDKVVVVIIDESQLLYSRLRTDVWGWLDGSDVPNNLRLVFFAAYGEKGHSADISTPYEFAASAVFGLRDIALLPEEFDELVVKLCPQLVAYMEAKAHIFSSTAGHVGLITTIFNALDAYSKEMLQRDDPNLALSEQQVLEFLLSPRLADAVRESRSYALSVQSEIMATVANRFLEEPCVSYDSAQHDVLIRSGLLVLETKGLDILVSFTAPLIRRAFILHFLSGQALLRQHSLTSCEFKTPKAFLFACLGSLSRRSLLNSQAVCTRGNLNETKFKLEVFFVARQLIGARARIDPEVGQVLKTADNAVVDFYISGKYNWAIAFLVESDRVGQPLQRFAEDGGCYRPIPCLEFLVVDFVRSEGTTRRESQCANNRGYFRVGYSSDLTQFTVEHMSTSETINLSE